MLYNLHDTLLVAHPDGTLEGGLAKHWEVPDLSRCVLTLRPGLTFHDGTRVNAEAVHANFARMLDPRTGSIRRGDLGPVAEVAVRDARTVELRLSEPYPPLLSILANRAGMMVSPTALARLGPDFAARAVGCGAFRLVSWTRDNELVLERFDGYWRGCDHAPDQIALRPLPDETARLANLRSGTLQLIDGVPPPAVDMLAREPGFSVARTPSIGRNAFSLNCTRPPFDDRRIRQAFVATIDPEVIHRLVYFGTGRVANGPIPPAIAWAFDPDFSPPRHDLDRARRLLAEAGGVKPRVTITITNAPLMLRIGEVLQAQSREAGFVVELRQIDPTILLSVLKQRDFDIAMSPWSGSFDPDGNLFFWFNHDGFANFSGYDSEMVTSLLHAARVTPGQVERAALYRRVQAIVFEDAPVLFLHFAAILQAATSRPQWTPYPDGVLRLFDARMA